MLYVQHINRQSQDVDDVLGLADTPSEALDVFEKHVFPEDFDYDRTETHERLCDQNDVAIEPSGPGSYYVLIAHA